MGTSVRYSSWNRGLNDNFLGGQKRVQIEFHHSHVHRGKSERLFLLRDPYSKEWMFVQWLRRLVLPTDATIRFWNWHFWAQPAATLPDCFQMSLLLQQCCCFQCKMVEVAKDLRILTSSNSEPFARNVLSVVDNWPLRHVKIPRPYRNHVHDWGGSPPPLRSKKKKRFFLLLLRKKSARSRRPARASRKRGSSRHKA